MAYESPDKIPLLKLLPHAGADVPGGEKAGVTFARNLLELLRGVLVEKGIAQNPTVQDLLGFEINFIGDSVCLVHIEHNFNVYKGVGFNSLKRIQSALETRCGRKLKVIDTRARTARTQKMDL